MRQTNTVKNETVDGSTAAPQHRSTEKTGCVTKRTCLGEKERTGASNTRVKQSTKEKERRRKEKDSKRKKEWPYVMVWPRVIPPVLNHPRLAFKRYLHICFNKFVHHFGLHVCNDPRSYTPQHTQPGIELESANWHCPIITSWKVALYL